MKVIILLRDLKKTINLVEKILIVALNASAEIIINSYWESFFKNKKMWTS